MNLILLVERLIYTFHIISYFFKKIGKQLFFSIGHYFSMSDEWRIMKADFMQQKKLMSKYKLWAISYIFTQSHRELKLENIRFVTLCDCTNFNNC